MPINNIRIKKEIQRLIDAVKATPSKFVNDEIKLLYEWVGVMNERFNSSNHQTAPCKADIFMRISPS